MDDNRQDRQAAGATVRARVEAALASGDASGAVGIAEEALRGTPDDPALLQLLAAAQFRAGRKVAATGSLKRIIQLRPVDPSPHAQLGALLADLRRTAEGIGHLEKAVALGDGSPVTLANLGAALVRVGDMEPAATHLRAALTTDPAHATANYNLGVALKTVGDGDGAAKHLRLALVSEPAHADAMFALAEIERPRPGDDLFDRLRALAGDAARETALRARASFAVGAAFERAGGYAEAWEHYAWGNARRRELYAADGRTYDPARHAAYISRIIDVFSKDFLAAPPAEGSDDARPVFIVGMPRSATTLVEQILASHPAVSGLGETTEIERLTAGLPIATIRIGGRGGVTKTAKDEHGGYPERFRNADAKALAGLASKYLLLFEKSSPSAIRIVEKTPFNFLHAGFIRLLLPRATFIHCRRDPLDTCVSNFLQDFVQPYAFTTDLADLGHYFRQYERLMRIGGKRCRRPCSP